MKRLMLVCVMMLCLMLCFNLSKAENPETILQITAEEKTHGLMEAYGVKATVVENAEGLCCIRVAHTAPDGSWILQSSPWMALPIWMNVYHSNDEQIELEYDLEEEDLYVSFYLLPNKDGSWYLGELDGCFLRQDVPYIVEVIDFHPDNNDDFHYGSLRISLALEDVNLELLPPYTGVFNSILDPDGWACVHVEGAILYDALNGEPIAACPLRVAGRVIEQTDEWTCLQIGSLENGLQGWYHTEDLVFGEKTEYVVCSYPSYNWDVFEKLDSVFPDVDIETDENSTRLWLIGRCPDGRWLVQINVDTVAFADEAAFTDIGPTEHDWNEGEVGYYEDEDDENDDDRDYFWETGSWPSRDLDIVTGEDGHDHLQITMHDGSGRVLLTHALPPYASFDEYHASDKSIMMEFPIMEDQYENWDEVGEAETIFLTVRYIDGDWRITDATNGWDWIAETENGVWRFDDWYADDEQSWSWEIPGEARLTEIDFEAIERMVSLFNEARPDRPNLPDAKDREKWEER